MTHRRPSLLLSCAALVLGVATLAGCSDNRAADGSPQDAPLAVVTAFYPLEYVAQRIGGDQVSVTDLTKPGAEPHDLELAPQDVGALVDSDLIVYLAGFQPAVDDAVSQQSLGQALDVSADADLSLSETSNGQSQTDPHFWLDPMRLADVGDAVAASMSDLDPSARSMFEANARDLRHDLESLDAQYRKTLSTCAHHEIVTSHSAFGYLAQAYGLDQVGLTGLTPEAEPSPQNLAAVADYVTAHDVQTIFYEPLGSPAVAQALATETGATTDVLDPIEGLSEQSQGDDYVSIMKANLANLKAGLVCQ